jgi:NAD(P)-dependent dehydrogenase (short-subunit alcohol dehydrogenase family)
MNRTGLVTGGTDGVGRSLARAMVKKQFAVHVVGSSEEKGKQLEADLNDIGPGSAKFWQLDLADIDAVLAFSKSFSSQVDHIDRLVFSAGVLLPRRMESPQGFELTFSIGYLSAYILVNKLQRLLSTAGNARVLMVSGGGAIVLRETLDFDNLLLTESYSAPKAAARTVHAKTVLAQVLAENFSDKGICVNAFHPGIVRSKLGRNLPGPLSSVFGMVSRLMSEDSNTGIYACLSEEMEGKTGLFLEGRKKKTLDFDKEYCERLIRETEDLLAEAGFKLPS